MEPRPRQNDAPIAMQPGRAYEASGDFGAARTNYFKAADRDNAYAQNNPGVLYDSGLGGFPKDDHEAVSCTDDEIFKRGIFRLVKALDCIGGQLAHPYRGNLQFGLEAALLLDRIQKEFPKAFESSAGGRIAYPNLSAYVARGEERSAFRRAFDVQLAVFTAASTS
jgi:hypothetical protein